MNATAAQRFVSCGPKDLREKDDFYPTPPEGTEALLSVEKFDGPIWEPACGAGDMSRELERGGYQAGTPDILVLFAGKAHFIELKAKKGKLSAEQIGQIEALNEASVPVEVCRSITDIGLALSRWQIPTREAEATLERRVMAARMIA